MLPPGKLQRALDHEKGLRIRGLKQRQRGMADCVGEPSRVNSIRAIARNTFRESVRDRILYNLILFVLILVLASVFISDLSIDQESKFIADLGLSAMLVFGTIIAIFIGVGLVYKEIDRRTIFNLLSKPVHRYEFIVGKYLGLCLTLLVNSAIMAGATVLALIYVNRGFTPLVIAVLPASFMIFLELALIVAVALMFSSFSTPMLSALFSFGLYVAGHFSADLKLAAELSGSAVARFVLTGLYYLLPNLSNFGYITDASYGRAVPLRMVIAGIVYALIYIGILISATVLIFERRNFR
jgi:ABC-type transport system involved in multi-copper enzyme maturation permease subunit